jgi:2-phosphosulfolactate phosphatase
MTMNVPHEAYTVDCAWGARGLARLLPKSDVVIIVDVLSFSTCVDIAVGNGAVVYPYPWKDATAQAFAQQHNAMLAGDRGVGYGLSPASLLHIPIGTSLVLPSPNGGTLSYAVGTVPTFAGCLRNAQAVALAAQKLGNHVSIIAAGERTAAGTLRPAIEDWLGVGAIIHHLQGTRSPQAARAERMFERCADTINAILVGCRSGQELVGRGFADDVVLAAQVNASRCPPLLHHGAYQSAS